MLSVMIRSNTESFVMSGIPKSRSWPNQASSPWKNGVSQRVAS